MFRGTDDLRGIAGKNDVAAAVISDDLRIDVPARAIRGGVHVGAEADSRNLLVGIRWNRRIDVAVFVHVSVVEPDVAKLLREQGAEVFLLLGGGAGRRI